MNANAYLKTSLSPYTLNGDAMQLIASLQEDFSTELEKKIIILINAATIHPSMSHYQLSLTHKALGDCYYDYGYFGSALEQYRRALDYNKNLPIKRRMNKMLSMSPENRKASLSPDEVYDVLQYPEYKNMVGDDAEDRKRMIDELWAGHEEEKQACDRARSEVVETVALDDSVIDPSHEAEIERRLAALGEPYKSSFYEVREQRRLTRRSDDTISMKEHDLLDLQAMEESKLFSVRHSESLARIDVDTLRRIRPDVPEPLTTPEIRFLERVHDSCVDNIYVPGYFTAQYQMDYKTVMEKLFSSGYLTFSTAIDNIKMADMDTLRELLKEKGLKVGGKKADLSQRVLDNYTTEELEALDLPSRYTLTEAGQQVIQKNEALIHFYLTFSYEWTTPENIITAQNTYPDDSGIDVLIRVAQDKIRETTTIPNKVSLCNCLRTLYLQKHDEESVQEIEAIVQQLNIEWKKERQGRNG